MKCPICGKDVELQKKQIGTSENGEPVFNQYAICRDCKKQWNLDKQRAKKMAAKKAAAAKASEKDAKESSEKSNEKSTEKQAAGKTSASKSGAVKKNPSAETAASKKPVKKRPATSDTEKKSTGKTSLEEQCYANIPPEKVRTKREKVARQGYEDMLATDPERKPVKRKRAEADTKAVPKVAKSASKAAPKSGSKNAARNSAKSTVSKSKSKIDNTDSFDSDEFKPARKGVSGKGTAVNTARKKPSPEPVEPEEYDYEDDYEYDDTPRFRPARIVLGILSLLGFAFFIYKGFVTGLSSVSSGDGSAAGTTYIVLALCMLVSAMLYFIMQKKNSVIVFLLPMVFYLGSAVFAFLKKGDGLEFLIAAVAGVVLAVISLILGIFSRGRDDYDDDDYDDPFEDDYED